MKQAGTTIGGTDSGAAEIWANFIAGTQAWLESAFEELFKPLLDANGYTDRYVRIRFKRPAAKRLEEVREQLKIGIAAGKLTTTEIRRNLTELDLDDTTPELIAELDAVPEVPGLTAPTQRAAGAQDEDLLAAKNAQEETSAEERAARDLERKLKMIDDRAAAALKKIIGASS
jgi:ribosomal protein L12E/L44/L45/RPP1/RPP2